MQHYRSSFKWVGDKVIFRIFKLLDFPGGGYPLHLVCKYNFISFPKSLTIQFWCTPTHWKCELLNDVINHCRLWLKYMQDSHAHYTITYTCTCKCTITDTCTCKCTIADTCTCKCTTTDTCTCKCTITDTCTCKCIIADTCTCKCTIADTCACKCTIAEHVHEARWLL